MKILNKVDSKKEWFERWFDSPYYHVLYQERDEQEAQLFLDHLIDFFQPIPGAKMLDVACGKGRHSIYLHRKGFDVTGFDLSPENIEFTRPFENDRLSFFNHDMREIFRPDYFDFVFNLFSSFGYFEDETDNAKTIFANAASLKPGGILVLDYMNSVKVKNSLICEENKIINGINFRITRNIENGNVMKKINFSDQGHEYKFYERLCLFEKKDFETYFANCHLRITNVFGDYDLKAFDEKESDRLILIAKKLG